LRHDRYGEIQQRLGCSDQDMAQKGLYKIHPKFRIIALAEPPGISGKFNLLIEIIFTYLFRISYIDLDMLFSR